MHDKLGVSEVAALLTRTVAWFVRVFTPPDQAVNAVRALAVQPWTGA